MEQNSRQKENSSYWRIEYQLRKREVSKLLNNPKHLLKGLSIIPNYNISSLNAEEQLIAYALINNKSFYQTLKNSYQRDKWKKQIKSLKTEELQPFIENEWTHHYSKTLDEVKKWMHLLP